MPVSIQLLRDVLGLNQLANDAQADGHGMVSRLIREWQEGKNRFDRQGERIYSAFDAGRICGVCGLNLDPFAGDATVGRVRRLYVAVASRRQGVGSAMMNRLMADAQNHFDELHLRTYEAGAVAFYEALGFSIVQGDPHCTHRLLFGAIDHPDR